MGLRIILLHGKRENTESLLLKKKIYALYIIIQPNLLKVGKIDTCDSFIYYLFLNIV
jgi:hypothetical protein